MNQRWMQAHMTAQQGFTLLEVLISGIILVIATLGIGMLQINAQRATLNAQYTTSATMLASDLAERMRANHAGRAIYIANLSNPANQNCENTSCTSVEMANFDLFTWVGAGKNLLPGFNAFLVQGKKDGTDPCPTLSPIPSVAADDYTIIILWNALGRTGSGALGSGGPGSGAQCHYHWVDLTSLS